MLVGKLSLFSSESHKELKKTSPKSCKDAKKLKSSDLQRNMTWAIIKLVENIEVVHLHLGHIARQHMLHAEITKIFSCYNKFITHYTKSIAWKFQHATTQMKDVLPGYMNWVSMNCFNFLYQHDKSLNSQNDILKETF